MERSAFICAIRRIRVPNCDQAPQTLRHAKLATSRHTASQTPTPPSSQMFWTDHDHRIFHAVYGGSEALIDIRTLMVIGGSLPRRVLALTESEPRCTVRTS